ncbi:MAG: formylmethanofuran dehydrogenase [Deltaproteobacteria bacterium HGW-Deltaproteobacteria-7]|jgi:formylmethanofuran dehydrogenase subunit E|nr:MAG: formylmethanofuran dehydrogenase [Deltaproteobacteria bacterium HGW-Deltaproteobacteria-7]PKN51750.1 MAG: formylmethanofuran dehydrogenase [Deltaproteobacteria bacterium HGW-Deltaproteobacteria-13]
MTAIDSKQKMPDDLRRCVEFHGHICPGLIYGYRVAKEAIRLMNLRRAVDEEVVAVCENDSCAVDAIQVLLGTAAGKGNLIIKDFGKNAYTVLNRGKKQAYRFSRKTRYEYAGKDKREFDRLDAAVANGSASEDDRRKLKRLKIDDLLARPFEEIFTTMEAPFAEPLYAPLAPSEPCAVCGEMTMDVKRVKLSDGRQVCIPCSQKS